MELNPLVPSNWPPLPPSVGMAASATDWWLGADSGQPAPDAGRGVRHTT